MESWINVAIELFLTAVLFFLLTALYMFLEKKARTHYLKKKAELNEEEERLLIQLRKQQGSQN